MPPALIDHGVGYQLLLSQAKDGQAAPAFPVLASNEKQDLDSQTLHGRLISYRAEQVGRRAVDGEPDHAKITFAFSVFCDPDRLRDGGAYAPMSAGGRLAAAITERSLVGSDHRLEIDQCAIEIAGPVDDAPSVVEVIVSGTGMLWRTTGTGEQDFDADQDGSGA